MTSLIVVYLNDNKVNTVAIILIKLLACYRRVKSNRIDLECLEYFTIKFQREPHDCFDLFSSRIKFIRWFYYPVSTNPIY